MWTSTIALQLLVVPSGVCQWSINPFTNTYPVYSHTYTWQYNTTKVYFVMWLVFSRSPCIILSVISLAPICHIIYHTFRTIYSWDGWGNVRAFAAIAVHSDCKSSEMHSGFQLRIGHLFAWKNWLLIWNEKYVMHNKVVSMLHCTFLSYFQIKLE
jgi:hypothetical protein